MPRARQVRHTARRRFAPTLRPTSDVDAVAEQTTFPNRTCADGDFMSQRVSIALLTILVLVAAPVCRANIIVTTPETLAGMFTMTDFAPDPRADDSSVTSVASPFGGDVGFLSEGGDPLSMTLDKNSGWFPAAFGE